MSEIATEMAGASELTATAEFLGSTFNDRRQALRQVTAFKKVTEQALADCVAMHLNQEVTMSFRPSSVATRKYNVSVPCYSLTDEVREPLVKDVTVRDVNDSSMTVLVTKGELTEGKYDAEWTVRIHNIIALEPTQSAPTE
jgi:hypothetical protein